MKFAYADPPYIGQAKRHYQSEEVDHEKLIKRLINEYPDGWALSLSPLLHCDKFSISALKIFASEHGANHFAPSNGAFAQPMHGNP